MVNFDVGTGKVYEIPEEKFILLLSGLAQTYAHLAEEIIQLHYAGLSYFNDTHFSKSIEHIQVQFLTIDKIVKDVELLEKLHSLLDYLKRLEENDKKIVYEYARVFNLIHQGKEIDIKKVKKKVHASRMQSVILPDSVLKISKESMSYLPEIQYLRKTIEERINYIYSDS